MTIRTAEGIEQSINQILDPLSPIEAANNIINILENSSPGQQRELLYHADFFLAVNSCLASFDEQRVSIVQRMSQAVDKKNRPLLNATFSEVSQD